MSSWQYNYVSLNLKETYMSLHYYKLNKITSNMEFSSQVFQKRLLQEFLQLKHFQPSYIDHKHWTYPTKFFLLR